MLILTYGISCSVCCTAGAQSCRQALASGFARGQGKVQGLTLIFGQRNRHACIRHSSIVIGQPCNIVKLERGFFAVIMGGHSHSKGICLVLLNGFAVQLVDLNGCVLTGGHSKACSFCNLSATCFLCSNGHSYSAVCCIGSRHNTELLSGQLAVIHITRHSRPSVAVITAPLHLAAGRAKGHLVNGIVIGGNTYGKVFCFTGFHSSTIKAGNSNLGRLPGRYSKGRACGCASNFIAACIHQLYGQGLLGCNSICIRYNTELLTGQVVNAQLIAGQVEPFSGITCSVLHLAARKVEFCLCGIGIALIGSDRKDITAFASLDSVIGGAADGNSGRLGGYGIQGVKGHAIICYTIKTASRYVLADIGRVYLCAGIILFQSPANKGVAGLCWVSNFIFVLNFFRNILCAVDIAYHLGICCTIGKGSTIGVKVYATVVADGDGFNYIAVIKNCDPIILQAADFCRCAPLCQPIFF